MTIILTHLRALVLAAEVRRMISVPGSLNIPQSSTSATAATVVAGLRNKIVQTKSLRSRSLKCARHAPENPSYTASYTAALSRARLRDLDDVPAVEEPEFRRLRFID